MINNKDKSIIDFVNMIQHEIDSHGWIIIDNWDADRFAVGIAKKANPKILVYISTYEKSPFKYDYECEMPENDQGLEYEAIDKEVDVDIKKVVSILKQHLKI